MSDQPETARERELLEAAGEAISRARRFEQETIAIRAALKKRGYTDKGIDRWVSLHFSRIRQEELRP